MQFTDRREAGRLLAQKLGEYKDKDVVVYALPRGGVVTAFEIAKNLHAPLDIIITRKISHPYNPEYAIAAIAGNGHMVGNQEELLRVDEDWLREETDRQREEIKRRKTKYLQGREITSPKGKIAILVDDGVATGLTMQAGLKELRHKRPQELIVAVPVIPLSTLKIVGEEADKIVALETPEDGAFLGAVGAYYASFPQVEDREVIRLLNRSKR